MTTYRVLVTQIDGVQLRCTHHIPPPLHAFVLAALERNTFEEFGLIVAFDLTLTERHTERGVEGNIEAQLSEGTLEEWVLLPILPPLEMQWEAKVKA